MGNSVIYRPAYDAEVEYLESTGTQWIDTGVYGNDDTAIECKVYITNTSKRFNIVGARDGFTNTISIMYIPYLIISDFKNITEQDGRLSVNKSSINNFIAYTSKSLRKIIDEYSENEWTLTQGMSGVSPSQSIKIGYKDVGYPDGYGNAYIKLYYCKIWNGSTLIRDFIPVRIGQVGYLYDKVSKQLFANKGTGNFILGNDVSNAVIPQQRCVLYFGNQRSVGFERIYEEYEWLKGDGSAYIDTNIKFTSDDVISIKFIPISLPDSSFLVFGDDSGNWNHTSLVLFYNYYLQLRPCVPNTALTRYTLNTIYEVQQTMTSYIVNGQELWHGDSLFQPSNYNCYLFASATKWTVNFNGKIANFSILNKINLIPCKLLQSIPAILDGNGIARQAGECGMWDKVSNKFYGNVANSGTFTVKGPKCYEEYKWLGTGSGNPHISLQQTYNTDENAFIETTYKCRYRNNGLDMCIGFGPTSGSNVGFRILNYSSNTTIIDIHRRVNGTHSAKRISVSNGQIGVPRYLYVSPTEYQVDNQRGSITLDMDFEGSTSFLGSVIYMNNSSNDVWYKETKIRANNITYDLIPCKLTHGIPASMDANGIARPAGTCGMWDKVNDVFYGNVASSGSFTVSND